MKKHFISILCLFGFSNNMICQGGNLSFAQPAAAPAVQQRISIPESTGTVKKQIKANLDTVKNTYGEYLRQFERINRNPEATLAENTLLTTVQELINSSHGLTATQARIQIGDTILDGMRKRLSKTKDETEQLFVSILGRQIYQFAQDIAHAQQNGLTNEEQQEFQDRYNLYAQAFHFLNTHLQNDSAYHDALDEMEGYLQYANSELQ